jgi:hypothetical protein
VLDEDDFEQAADLPGQWLQERERRKLEEQDADSPSSESVQQGDDAEQPDSETETLRHWI